MKKLILTLTALLSISSFASVIKINAKGNQVITNAGIHCAEVIGGSTYYTNFDGVEFSDNTIELDYNLLGKIDKTCTFARIAINTSEIIDNVNLSEHYVIDLDSTEKFYLVHEEELFLRKTNKSIDDRADHLGDHFISGMKKAGEIIGFGAYLILNPDFNGIP